MSTCISIEGEYGSHEVGEFGTERFTCRRCFVFDQDAAMAALDAAEKLGDHGSCESVYSDLLARVESAESERDSLAVQLDEALGKVGRVAGLADKWADVLAECKQVDPRWILDRSVTTLDTAHAELTAALAGPSPTDEGGES